MALFLMTLGVSARSGVQSAVVASLVPKNITSTDLYHSGHKISRCINAVRRNAKCDREKVKQNKKTKKEAQHFMSSVRLSLLLTT